MEVIAIQTTVSDGWRLPKFNRSLLSAAAVLVLGLCMPAFLGCTPAQKQTTLQVVQSINTRLPGLTASADALAATINAAAALDPVNGPEIIAAVTVGDKGFDVLSKSVQDLAAAYIANPDAGTLALFQAAIAALEKDLSTASLNAVGLKNSQVQQMVVLGLRSLSTAATIIFGLILPTMTTAQLQELRSAGTMHLAALRPYLDADAMRRVAVEQGSPRWLAAYEVDKAFATAEAAGF